MPRHVYLSIRENAQACLSLYTRECPGMSIPVYAWMPRHVYLSIRVNAQACLSQYTRDGPGMSISVYTGMPRHVHLSTRANAQACPSQYTLIVSAASPKVERLKAKTNNNFGIAWRWNVTRAIDKSFVDARAAKASTSTRGGGSSSIEGVEGRRTAPTIGVRRTEPTTDYETDLIISAPKTIR